LAISTEQNVWKIPRRICIGEVSIYLTGFDGTKPDERDLQKKESEFNIKYPTVMSQLF